MPSYFMHTVYKIRKIPNNPSIIYQSRELISKQLGQHIVNVDPSVNPTIGSPYFGIKITPSDESDYGLFKIEFVSLVDDKTGIQTTNMINVIKKCQRALQKMHHKRDVQCFITIQLFI